MAEPELKPCPWCGQSLHVSTRRHNPYAECRTPGCFAEGRFVINPDVHENVVAWTRRPEADPVREALVKLRYRLQQEPVNQETIEAHIELIDAALNQHRGRK